MINDTRVVETAQYDYLSKCRRKCISWSAIIAGSLVGFSISFLLNLFGVAIGLTAFTNTKEGVHAFLIGDFIGLIIVSIVSMFVAGMVAGYLGRRYCFKKNLGALYGFLTFGLSLFLAIFLTAPISTFVSSYNAGLFSDHHAAVVANPMSDSSTVVTPQGATTNARAMDSTNSSAAAATEDAVNDLGKAAFLTFLLFAIGAFSACIGGHWGMKCKCYDDEDYCETKRVSEDRVVR